MGSKDITKELLLEEIACNLSVDIRYFLAFNKDHFYPPPPPHPNLENILAI